MSSQVLEPIQVELFEAPHSDGPIPNESRGRRLLGLGLVLLVALPQPIMASLYALRGGVSPTDAGAQQWQLMHAIAFEVAGLAVLWYVMTQQGKGWRSMGWSFTLLDPVRALGLVLGAAVAEYVVCYAIQVVYYSIAHHYLIPKSLHAMLGLHMSAVLILFACVNPFFEELIVRGFVMTELRVLGAAQWVAIVTSVGLQISYHLYQGFFNVIALTVIFTVYSIYYARSRRIMPVILAHLALDLYAVLAGVA